MLFENANVTGHLSETFSMLSASEISISRTLGNAIRLARTCYLTSIVEMVLAAKGGVVRTSVTAMKCPRMLALLLNYRLYRKKYDEMKTDMDTLSCASARSLLPKIKNLTSRPIVEFNKYEVLDLLEALRHCLLRTS